MMTFCNQAMLLGLVLLLPVGCTNQSTPQGATASPSPSATSTAARVPTPLVVQSNLNLATSGSATSVIGTFNSLPTNGNLVFALIQQIQIDSSFVPPTGWQVATDEAGLAVEDAENGFALMWGVVGSRGLTAATSYTFGTGTNVYYSVILWEVSGGGTPIFGPRYDNNDAVYTTFPYTVSGKVSSPNGLMFGYIGTLTDQPFTAFTATPSVGTFTAVQNSGSSGSVNEIGFYEANYLGQLTGADASSATQPFSFTGSENQTAGDSVTSLGTIFIPPAPVAPAYSRRQFR